METQIVDGKEYFVCKKTSNSDIAGTLYWSRLKNGTTRWSYKPGIAVHFPGGEALRNILANNEGLFVKPVPANADKKWRRRI